MPSSIAEQKDALRPRNALGHFFQLPNELREKVSCDGGLSTKDKVSFFSSSYLTNKLKLLAEHIAACNVTYIEFDRDQSYRASAFGDSWPDQADPAKDDLLDILTHYSHPVELMALIKAMHDTLSVFMDNDIPKLIKSRYDFLKQNDKTTCLYYMSEIEFNMPSIVYYQALVSECLEKQQRLMSIARDIASTFNLEKELDTILAVEHRGECRIKFSR